MTRLRAGAAVAALAFAAAIVTHAARVGDPAPAFTGTDTKGKVHSLSDFKGKFVVLEWHNQGCPYVKKHYGSGNMQRLQKEWTAKGVVWLTIISSAPNTQGYVTAEQADTYVREQHAVPTAVILDPSGEIGRAYDAKTTPHMFVVDPAGRLIYNGAIDDKPTTDQADIASAHDYVSAALKAAMAGQPVATAATKPYGCSVKYGSGT